MNRTLLTISWMVLGLGALFLGLAIGGAYELATGALQ